MTAISRPMRVFEFMQQWKMATPSQIREFAFSNEAISDAVFWNVLKRLKKRHLLQSVQCGLTTVYFSYAYKRWRHLSKLPLEHRAAFIQSSGIQHNLDMLELAGRFQQLQSQCWIKPNIHSEEVLARTSATSHEGNNFFPDLVIQQGFSQESSTLFYIEVERTLKAKERYKDRWRAYEADNKIKSCLYFTPEALVESALAKMAIDFFRRDFGSKRFSIGVLRARTISDISSDSTVSLFSLQKKQGVKLGEFFTAVSGVEHV